MPVTAIWWPLQDSGYTREASTMESCLPAQRETGESQCGEGFPERESKAMAATAER